MGIIVCRGNINHDCLPISLLLHMMPAYLMLSAALSIAVCLYDAYFYAIDLCKCFLASCLVLVYWHIVCLFLILFCIMLSAFNLLVFLILDHTVFLVKGQCALWRDNA